MEGYSSYRLSALSASIKFFSSFSSGRYVLYLLANSFSFSDITEYFTTVSSFSVHKIIPIVGLSSTPFLRSLTTPADIGKLTAEIFFTEPQIENEIVYIAGDTITYGQLADIAESLSGQKYDRTLSDMEEIDNDLNNDPSNFVKKYRSIFGSGKGVSWSMEDSFNVRKGIQTISAKQWAKENIDWELYNK
jgi:hypothetical protein